MRYYFDIRIKIRILIYIVEDIFMRLLWLFNNHKNHKNDLFFHCANNLGDNIQNIIFLNKLSKNFKKFNFFYGVKKSQIIELKKFVEQNNLIILPIFSVRFNSYNLWKNRYYFWSRSRDQLKYDYYKFYIYFFSKVCDENNLKKIIFNKNQLFSSVKNNNDKFAKYDILFINSKPTSNQLIYNEKRLETIISETSKKYSVITTKKIKNIPCTRDKSLSIYEIGQLSYNCSCIIAISTGPIWAVLNQKNFRNKKPMLIFNNSENLFFNDNTVMSKNTNDIKIFLKKYCLKGLFNDNSVK